MQLPENPLLKKKKLPRRIQSRILLFVQIQTKSPQEEKSGNKQQKEQKQQHRKARKALCPEDELYLRFRLSGRSILAGLRAVQHIRLVPARLLCRRLLHGLRRIDQLLQHHRIIVIARRHVHRQPAHAVKIDFHPGMGIPSTQSHSAVTALQKGSLRSIVALHVAGGNALQPQRLCCCRGKKHGIALL